jgi:Flp pilus assembly protein TadD
LNAFTTAIELDSKNVGYLSSRSAVYLKLGRPSDTMSDCIKALELLAQEDEIIIQDLITESVTEKESRRKSKLKLYIRQGAAALAMGDNKTSLNSYKKALELEPNNHELIENVSNLSKLINL